MLTWVISPADLGLKAIAYGGKLEAGVTLIAKQEATAIAADMKRNHPWHNRTGNAERGLYAKTNRQGTEVQIIFGHTVKYGPFLENGTRFMHPYPIVKPTGDAHAKLFLEKVRALMSGA